MSVRRLIGCGATAVLVTVAGLWVTGAPARAAPAPGRRLHLTVTLRPRHPAALAAYVRAVSTPGSAVDGDYLTPRQFGRRFGAGPERTARMRAALRARGLDPGRPSAGGLSIPLTAAASTLSAAGRRLHDALPRTARASVQAVLGQSAGLAGHPLAVRAPRRLRHARAVPAARRGATAAPGPAPCSAATAAADHDGAYTDDTIAGAYDFPGLYAAGDEGAGTTVAVYELEPDDPHDIAAFQSCYGTHAQVSYIPVDGGAGEGPGSDEAAFDIENVIGFAPRARVLVYQGPNSVSGLPGSGPYDVFSAIVNQDQAQVVSVSWGQCEAQLGTAAAKAEHTLFEQAAVEGQTLVAAAGDDGAEDCDTGGADSSLTPAVDDPAAQPGVLGVGGTTLHAGPPVVQTAWNSDEADPAGTAIGAGGGGISARWPMAPDQFDTPAGVHVRHAAAGGAACGQTAGYCREVPDVAADADPTTGYEIYWNGADTVPEPSGWQALGGTSGAAPLWAALVALADASPACDGSPLGDVGPALYRAAGSGGIRYAADFTDITAGENDFTGTDGGRWPAGPGYDLATGLGTPHGTALAASLCADSVRLTAPAGQSSAVDAAVGLRLRGQDVRGARLTYTAAHLPPGVRLDPRTGRLHGRPRRPGRYEVLAVVRDGHGGRASSRFSWTIGGRPQLIAARLTPDRLTLQLRSGPHVPWLRRVRVHLPAKLRTGSPPRIVVGARGRARVRVRDRVVTVSLGSPAPALRLEIPVHGSSLARRVSVGVRAGSTGTSVLTRAIAQAGA